MPLGKHMATVHVAISDEEKKALEAKAAADCRSMANYVRVLILRDLEGE